jgi:exodeoxyribonuclease VII large subunit
MSQPAFDFDDAELDDAGDPTYSVCELAEAINDQFRRGFRDGVWVRGEINGLQERGPHTYFSLVEDGADGKGVLRVQFFGPAKRRMIPVLRRANLDLRDGMKVRIRGFLDYWAQGGSLGLKMTEIDPRYTLGEIAQSRDEIMRRLVASGLIDLNKRQTLSPIPLRIGVATSLDSAAWADFRGELMGSGFGFDLTVADTRVQGEGADRMVAGAIGTLARGARAGLLDAIVVIRGGGARNELAVFDSERIAHTIVAVPIPVLTGLGHEIDRSIADEVAHTALKTPTACAGALIERVASYVNDTESAFEAIARRALSTADASERQLHDIGRRIAGRTGAAIERADERLTMRCTRLIATAPSVLSRSSERLDTASVRLLDRANTITDRERGRLEVCSARVTALDPAVQLARGWSITRDASGQVVRSTAELVAGDVLSTRLIDGEITSVVDTVLPRPAPASVVGAAPESDPPHV